MKLFIHLSPELTPDTRAINNKVLPLELDMNSCYQCRYAVSVAVGKVNMQRSPQLLTCGVSQRTTEQSQRKANFYFVVIFI
jgi:hypothetical protein